MAVRTLAGTSVGDTIESRTIAVGRDTLVAYAAASGDQNPIHQDEQFARSVGLPDVIAHGMWTMGAAGSVEPTAEAKAARPSALTAYGPRGG